MTLISHFLLVFAVRVKQQQSTHTQRKTQRLIQHFKKFHITTNCSKTESGCSAVIRYMAEQTSHTH